MPYMEWKAAYSVGSPDFDDHHRHLFDLLNKAYDACMLNKQHEVFCSIVSELADYANYHFSSEEKLMEELSYPGLAAHREEHAIFTGKIAELRGAMPESNCECTIDLVELTQFMMNWLTHHILDIDKQYSRHLIKR